MLVIFRPGVSHARRAGRGGGLQRLRFSWKHAKGGADAFPHPTNPRSGAWRESKSLLYRVEKTPDLLHRLLDERQRVLRDGLLLLGGDLALGRHVVSAACVRRARVWG